ncbi:hypothetical protein ACIQZB_35985 [Streptomyces sp. NPDC097727]|uniref:hypothetical protein n=1 Tax=Streptomyces sp. NPDC097727 TaxID=3366092 RepID=UPI00380E3282
MADPNLPTGSIWRLRHGDQEIARLTVTGADMPWTHAEVGTVPGFEEFCPVFTEQERAVDEEDWERADACYTRIRSALTMALPDGSPVAEFMLHIHDDRTAGLALAQRARSHPAQSAGGLPRGRSGGGSGQERGRAGTQDLEPDPSVPSATPAHAPTGLLRHSVVQHPQRNESRCQTRQNSLLSGSAITT